MDNGTVATAKDTSGCDGQWHRRLGHLPIERIREMQVSGVVTGLTLI